MAAKTGRYISGQETRPNSRHGDLRNAIVEAAFATVRVHGAESFSLRNAARETGVSSGAAYRHFSDRTAVLAEVARLGHRAMAERIQAEGTGLSGRELLISVGRGYVAFAAKESHLFRLIFGHNEGSSKLFTSQECMVRENVKFPSRTIRVPSAFDQLRSALADARRETIEAIPPDLLLLAWATAHGVSSLVASGVMSKSDPRVAQILEAYANAALATSATSF